MVLMTMCTHGLMLRRKFHRPCAL